MSDNEQQEIPQDREQVAERLRHVAAWLQLLMALASTGVVFWIARQMAVWQQPHVESVALIVRPHWFMLLPGSLFIGLMVTYLDFPRVLRRALGWTRYAAFKDEIAREFADRNYGDARGCGIIVVLIGLVGMTALTGQCECLTDQGITIQKSCFAAPRELLYSDVRAVYALPKGKQRAGVIVFKDEEIWIPGNFIAKWESQVWPAGTEADVLAHVAHRTGLPIENISSLNAVPQKNK